MKASRGEIKIHEILEENGVNFKEEYEFPGLKAPNNHYIYVHVNKINGKGYVGQTTNPKDRWSKSGYRYKECPLLWRAIQKYGWDNFEHIIIESGLSQSEANKREEYWIEKLNTYGDSGYNLTPGGDNFMSKMWQDEKFKKKMKESFSQARKKQWSDPEYRDKAQAALQKGVQAFWSDPVRRKKRIDALTGEKNPNHKAVQNIETGKIFPTIKEATEWAGLKAVSCIGENCRGNKKSAGRHPITGEKLHWKYIGGDSNESESRGN